MVQLIVWGNNVAGNLTPVTDDHIYLEAPTIVKRNGEEQIETVIWTSWTCTIVKCVSGKHEIWGRTGLQSDDTLLEILDKGECARIIGDDQPRAILRNDGKVEILETSIEPTISKESYKDVIMTGLRSIFSVSDDGIFRFDSLRDLISNKDAIAISHPAIDLSKSISLHAAESRVLLFLRGALPHLFELKPDQQGHISVNLIEDLEGLGVESVVAGSGTGNRFAAITEGGDGYIIPKGSIEVEPIELEDASGVRLIGLGSKFEVIVTGDSVWVRGDNGFSQLGMPSVPRKREEGDETTEFRTREKEEDQDEDYIKHPFFVDPTRIKAVHCGRWSTVVEMHDP